MAPCKRTTSSAVGSLSGASHLERLRALHGSLQRAGHKRCMVDRETTAIVQKLGIQRASKQVRSAIYRDVPMRFATEMVRIAWYLCRISGHRTLSARHMTLAYAHLMGEQPLTREFLRSMLPSRVRALGPKN